MPSKKRWTLIPRKWFGTIANATHKRDQAKKSQLENHIPPLISSVPHRLIIGNKTKIEPSFSNDSTNTLTTMTHVQLPAFNTRRGRTSTMLPSSTLFNRTNTFAPTHTAPSICKNGQLIGPLPIYRLRGNSQTKSPHTSNIPSLSSQYETFRQQNANEKRIDISDQCLMDYPQTSSNQFSKKSSSLTRTHSSSSSMENNDSSSSGIFSDERTHSHDRHRITSKDTLSTLEILSTESLIDSRTSLDQYRSRTPTHHYRLSVRSFELIDNKSGQLQHRVHSAEGILKDTQMNRSITTKARQSSAAIIKKIEKRIPTNRLPNTPSEKTNFIRIANDTYRLTTDKDNHLYRRQRPKSIIQHSFYDDPLPSANNEDCYAKLPRTSSTEQLDNNLQNDLRAIVDDCLRPIVTSIDKTIRPSTKIHHYSKRSHPNTNEHTQVIIENITDKLLSSIDSSIYAQYQRCC